MAETLKIIALIFGRIDVFIKQFRFLLTFKMGHIKETMAFYYIEYPLITTYGLFNIKVHKSPLFFQFKQFLDSGAEFCLIFCSFFGQWSFKKKYF